MNNAFLVRTSISMWTARKMDKSATKAAKEKAGASERANVKVYKTVLATDALDAIDKIANAARMEHKKRTVPYCYDGPGMITAEGYPAYKAAMAVFEKQFFAAVGRFQAVYAEEREAAREYLGDMFNAADYPASAMLGQRFAFFVSAEPMPVAENFQPQGLAPALVEEIRRDIVQNNVDAIDNANLTAWGRVIEKVEMLKVRMEEYNTGKITKFYPSWVENIGELATMIPSINIAGDPDLARIGQKLVALTAYSPDDLKADTKLCGEIAKAAAIVLAQINEAHRKAA